MGFGADDEPRALPWAGMNDALGVSHMSRLPRVASPTVRGHCRRERRKDRWFCNPKGIVSSSPATESARLPWVSVRAILNPNGVVSPLRHRATTPLGLADTTRFSQGSSRLATLGLGAESLWDSSEISARLAQILTRQWAGSLRCSIWGVGIGCWGWNAAQRTLVFTHSQDC